MSLISIRCNETILDLLALLEVVFSSKRGRHSIRQFDRRPGRKDHFFHSAQLTFTSADGASWAQRTLTTGNNVNAAMGSEKYIVVTRRHTSLLIEFTV